MEGDLPSFDAKSAVDTRDTVGIFPECGERDLERAHKAASAAFTGWSATPAQERGALVAQIGESLARHQSKLAAIITREVGKTPREAMLEVQEAIEGCRYMESESLRLHGYAVASEQPGRELFAHRRPLGVCGILAASSSPLAIPCRKVMAAILCGNTVIWKPSQNTPTIAYLLVRCMMDAGLPPGVVNVVNGKGRGCGKAFVAGIDKGFYQKLSFTGSTALGRAIGEAAGRNLLPSTLELGAKNPMVVMPDADLDHAVAEAVLGAFGGAGQHCTSLANILLHQDVAAAFKDKFLTAVAALEIGNPVTDPDVAYGPMINARLAKAFEEHWTMGREDGARLLCGGARWSEDNRTDSVKGFITKGQYMQACVWEDVTPDMRLFQTEVYGPTVNLTTVDSFDQALAYANGTPYGMLSSIFSQNREWIERFKRESSAALTYVNLAAPGAEAYRPMAGTGWSGNGTRETGRQLFDTYTLRHLVNDDPLGTLAVADGTRTQYEPSHWDRL